MSSQIDPTYTTCILLALGTTPAVQESEIIRKLASSRYNFTGYYNTYQMRVK